MSLLIKLLLLVLSCMMFLFLQMAPYFCSLCQFSLISHSTCFTAPGLQPPWSLTPGCARPSAAVGRLVFLAWNAPGCSCSVLGLAITWIRSIVIIVLQLLTLQCPVSCFHISMMILLGHFHLLMVLLICSLSLTGSPNGLKPSPWVLHLHLLLPALKPSCFTEHPSLAGLPPNIGQGRTIYLSIVDVYGFLPLHGPSSHISLTSSEWWDGKVLSPGSQSRSLCQPQVAVMDRTIPMSLACQHFSVRRDINCLPAELVFRQPLVLAWWVVPPPSSICVNIYLNCSSFFAYTSIFMQLSWCCGLCVPYGGLSP